MIKVKLTTSVILLILTLPGCLARYGEGRLEYLCKSIKDLEKECEKNREELTEEKIKEKLGKPKWLKPIYETDLNLASCKTHKTLRDLNEDKGVLLKYYPDNLYDVLSGKHGRLKNLKLLSYVYDRMGFEDPSLTFYIGSLEGTVENEPKVFGWDYVEYGNKNRCNCNGVGKAFINYKIYSPADYLRLPYTFLIDTVIGIKQFVGEVIKSPISFIEAEFIENILVEKKIPFYKFKGFKAAGEDWRNGITALTYRYSVDGNQGILATTQNLLGEVPVVGSFFDQWSRKDSGTANKLFLTRGIYGGDDSAQNMDQWVHYLTNPPVQECPPDQSTRQSGSTIPGETNRVNINNPCVKVIPYRYGSGTDVFWALLNISHGYAYEMASEIVSKCDVHSGDSVLLGGHSGGVQRNIAAARILNDDGIMVKKIYGIAGPALGYAPCEEIKVVLNSKLLQDPVSEVSRLLRYITLDLLTLNIVWPDDKCEGRREEDEYYKHKTPGFVDGRTRLKYDGYLNACLTDFFK